MKFLLIGLNAKYIHSNPALYSLRAYAAAQDAGAAGETEIVEYTINQQLSDILADLYEKRPDAAAFSCYIWNRRQVLELAGALHSVMPRLPIWFGGPEVSYDAQAVLREAPYAAGVLIGEGEETFWELLELYRKEETPDREALRRILGLALWDARTERTVFTPRQKPLEMDRLPFFYRDVPPAVFENRILYYESSRGCPFHCAYCLSSLDEGTRQKSLDRVKEELRFFLDGNVAQVKFLDRTFNCDSRHAVEIWRYLLENDNGVTNFHFEVEADLLTEEELHLLGRMRPGQVQLEIGVQSTNPATLRAVGRRADIERLTEAVKRLRAGGNVHLHLDLIAGLPYEGLERFRESFDAVYRMRPHQLQLGFLKLLKGTQLAQKAGEYGIVCWAEPPYEVLRTDWLSYGEIVRLKKVETMVEQYYNSSQFVHLLGALEAGFASPFAFYEALADFYDRGGYFFSQPARTYRYQILLDFAIQRDPARGDLYRELAVYDFYLRENAKSRPAFAGPSDRGRERIGAFYREGKCRRYLPGYEEWDSRQIQRMTHLELFDWPPDADPGTLLKQFDSDRAGKKEIAILFDYQNRDPVSQNAGTMRVEL